MAFLYIKTLTCNETEDVTGPDECRLDVYSETGRRSYRKDMNNGDVWDINDEVPFRERVKVQLWDIDLGRWPDPHDRLGTVNIRATPVENATASFTDDGADYVLTYDVRA